MIVLRDYEKEYFENLLDRMETEGGNFAMSLGAYAGEDLDVLADELVKAIIREKCEDNG